MAERFACAGPLYLLRKCDNIYPPPMVVWKGYRMFSRPWMLAALVLIFAIAGAIACGDDDR